MTDTDNSQGSDGWLTTTWRHAATEWAESVTATEGSQSPGSPGPRVSRVGWPTWKTVVQFGGLIVATAVTILIVTVFAVLPAYKNPQARIYTSGLGYAKVIRRTGGAFPVKIGHVTRRHFSEPILGEGIMNSRPVMVPIIPMDYVTDVFGRVGQTVKKGDLLARLDSRSARFKVESARLAVSTTQAEANRVTIGSAYVLAQERPEQDRINLEAARQRMEKIREQQELHTNLYEKGIISRARFLELEKELIGEEQEAKIAMFKLGMSTEGVKESFQIAKNAVEDAKRALMTREQELIAYDVLSPADGVIERVLISEGEYNQDSGKPGFVIASGLWFEAHLDQRVIDRIRVGQKAMVYLEAYPAEPFSGAITKVVPIVSFNLGGPETNRPIRPRGSGGPEWPATFVVRIALDAQDQLQREQRLVPGMTGFGQILFERESVALPLSAISSLSAGCGLVHRYHDDGTWSPQTVRTGIIQDGYIEVLSGLTGEETIIIEGFEVLEASDKVKVSNPEDQHSKREDSVSGSKEVAH